MTSERESNAGIPRTVPLSRGLSARLLVLTALFVMAAEILIFLPSIASYRHEWLRDRLTMAATASMVVLAADFDDTLPAEVRDDVLMAIGARAIAIREAGESRLLVVTDVPIAVDEHVALDEPPGIDAIRDALSTLFTGGDRVLRVWGNAGRSDKEFEIVIEDRALRAAMLEYSRNVAIVSLILSLLTATLVFYAINRMMIRPIRRMTRSMLDFGEAPEDPARIIRPSGRRDEIGVAEQQLAAMQGHLRSMFAQQKHLADLGLAVSKINHDMRNILTPAQLLSDRLAGIADPSARSIVPKLVRTIDRAISYTENVLAYGRAQEAAPSRRRIRLRRLVADVFDLLAIGHEDLIEFDNRVDPAIEVDADSDQLFRVLTNLCRNSVQAMLSDRDAAVIRRLSVHASRQGTVVRILVEDTGPGLPAAARENLFAAFRGSARSGGTGLGLAIASELVRAHGGTLELLESTGGRTVFAITLPDQPVILSHPRNSARGQGAAAGN